MCRWFILGLALTMAGCGISTDAWLAQLKDADVVKRREAIRELSMRRTEARRVIPALAEALRDENGYVRHDAALAIGKYGPAAREAWPALTAVLATDQARPVRVAAVSAMKRVDPLAARKLGIR